MDQRNYRLKLSSIVEPLIGKWWAWSHLISPAAASLHLANYQVPALESYLVDPESHVRACRDPELIGGAFVDVSPERAGEIRELLQATLRVRSAELQLAAELPVFSERLARTAVGQSLEPVYETVPESLKGCVELVYDYLHRSSCRIIEKLLYSRYYNPGLQTLRLFTKNANVPRPFFMSSPRLIGPGDLEWKVEFADARVDELFKTDLAPAPLSYFRELLNVDDSHLSALMGLVEENGKPSGQVWSGTDIRVRHFGHACMLIEWNGTSILTDPVIETNAGTQFHGFDELPPHIDFALVTHNHQDHMSLETVLRLRRRIGTIVVPKSMGLLYGDVSLKAMLQAAGFQNVIEMDALDSIGIPDGEIIAVPFLGEHADLAHGKSGYVVRAGKHKMWFSADSDCLEPRTYEQLRKAIGRIETLFVGCESVGAPLSWSCGPFFPRKPTLEQENTRRYHGCNARAALELGEAVGARRIFNYAMGLEPWMEFILGLCMTPASPQWRESEKLLFQARRRGLTAERPFGRWEKFFSATGAETFAGWSAAETQQQSTSPAGASGGAAAVPQTVVNAATKLAAELECGLPSVYVAALCVAESGLAGSEISVVAGEGQASGTAIDLSGNPTFRSLIERAEIAIARATENVVDAVPVFSFRFEGFTANSKTGPSRSSADGCYSVTHKGRQVNLDAPQASQAEPTGARLERYLSILESGVNNPNLHFQALVPQPTAVEVAEAEFAF